MTLLNISNVFTELEAVAVSTHWKSFSLPSGKRIIVSPDDGFETLHTALRDSEFINLLKEAVEDVKKGNVSAVEDDYFHEDSDNKCPK